MQIVCAGLSTFILFFLILHTKQLHSLKVKVASLETSSIDQKLQLGIDFRRSGRLKKHEISSKRCDEEARQNEAERAVPAAAEMCCRLHACTQVCMFRHASPHFAQPPDNLLLKQNPRSGKRAEDPRLATACNTNPHFFIR